MLEPFKPNSLKKTWWKFTDREKYYDYKFQKDHYKAYLQLHNFNKEGALSLPKILEMAKTTDVLNFSHSGNSGDVIYALPTIKKISELVGKPVNLLLELNVPMQIAKYYVHPLGSVMLNQKMANAIIPLIGSQHYINSCEVLTDQTVHINLAKFRDAGILTDKGDIARWNFYTTGVIGDLNNPWLHVDKDAQYADMIVVARSSRYNNPVIEHSILSDYANLGFVGVDAEFTEMQKKLPHIKHLVVKDFLQMAQIIASCKLFIGNQSFPYSIAEGLKVKRLLEVYYQAPNVIPNGANGYDFYFQDHFKYLVDAVLNDTI